VSAAASAYRLTMSHGERWRGLAVDIRRAAKPASREQLGLASIEGTRLCERALRAGAVLTEVLIARSLLSDPTERVRDLLVGLEQSGAAIVAAPDDAVVELCEGRDVGHMLGLVRLPSHSSLRELVESSGTPNPRLLVLVDVEEPGNVGALVRTALAAGAIGCVCVGRSDAWHPKALRTSMGSVFRIPTPRISNVGDIASELRNAGIRSIGAVSSGGDAPWAIAAEGPSALLLGSEAFGLPPGILNDLDASVTIPMPNAVDSFSVNAAAAILLYEAGRPKTG
jgi:TrmH family RNA methyltransferase